MFLGEKKNCLTISSRMEPHFSGDDTSIAAQGLPGWIGGRGARGDLLPRYNVNIDIRGVGGRGLQPPTPVFGNSGKLGQNLRLFWALLS